MAAPIHQDDAPPGPERRERNPYRLPRTVVPRRYELTLEPDLEAATFAGSETVALDVREPTRDVVLNAAELAIDEAVVELPDGSRHPADVHLDPERERVAFRTARTLPPGPALLHLRFRGVLNDKLRGFYRSTFTDDQGVERTLATTQMEATDARRAFPCWDEPDAKAVFSVTLVVPDDLLAVSNAAEVSRRPAGDGKVAVGFADTMPMSTYLVAFVVGPLTATEPVLVDGTPLRVVCPIGKEHLASYALEVGAFALRFYREWFDIPYPGDKLDLVAIPDFAFGAMENLGCVTFRERLVLVDPATATQSERQAVVDVIAHEIAHMWFGDLVTMSWWNGIWLNEAFAVFMEMTCTDAFRPDWQRWVDFGLSRSAAFDTDALTSTRPVEYRVVSPQDAEGMFDILTYEKGASVVRMLEQYLGPDRFRSGIRRYMAQHRYGNTETSDLWDALEAETGEPVRRIADSWIFQGGFPEVAVSLADDGDAGRRLRLRQRRFGYEAVDETTLWAIPIVIEHMGRKPATERILLDDHRADVTLQGNARCAKVNAGAHGFYRVRYASDLLDELLRHADMLTPIERYTLVDDAWAAVLAGGLSAGAFLDLTDRLAGETDLSVWERIVAGLGALDRIVDGEPRRRLTTRIRALTTPARQRLGPSAAGSDDDRTQTLRGVLLQAAAVLGDDTAAQERCRDLLEQFLSDPTQVDPSLSAPALYASATLGDTGLHHRLVEHFTTTQNPQDRERILRSLARFRDAEPFGRTLELTLSGEVRSQDAPYLLGEALASRDNGAAAWAFVSENWDEVNRRFPTNSIPRMVGGVRAVRQRPVAERIAAFLAEHPIPQGELQVRQHVERMWVTVALAEREAEPLAAHLTP